MDGGCEFWARAQGPASHQSPAASPGSGTRCLRPAPADPPPSPCLRRPTARRAPQSPGSLRAAPWGGRSRRWARRMPPGWSLRTPWLQRREESPKGTRAAGSARTELLCGRQPHAEEEGARASPPPPRLPGRHPPARPAPRSRRPLVGGNQDLPEDAGLGSTAPQEKATPPPRPGAPLQGEPGERKGAGAGLRARFSLNAPPTRPSSRFSNWRGGEVCACASDYNSRQRSGGSDVYR